MGLFKRDRVHKSYAEIKAENEAKREAKAAQRHAEGKTTLTERLDAYAAKSREELDASEDNLRLRKIAADMTRSDEERSQARAALAASIGEERADRVIRAEARLMRKGWRK